MHAGFGSRTARPLDDEAGLSAGLALLGLNGRTATPSLPLHALSSALATLPSSSVPTVAVSSTGLRSRQTSTLIAVPGDMLPMRP